MKISEVLAGKSSDEVVRIGPDATVRELIALLAEHNIGAVVVSANGSSLDGIVSERDVVRRLVSEGDGVLDRPVSGIMTAQVRTCEATSSLDEVRELMTTGRFRHLPVVDGGRVVGVVSIGDVVKSHINQVEFERDQLESYVKSGTV